MTDNWCKVVESLFILNKITGDPIYREMGWEIFQSIEKYCKTQYGYGAYPDVRDTTRPPNDSMESFFLGETLKYLYLLMDPDSEVDLDTVSHSVALKATIHDIFSLYWKCTSFFSS